MAIGGKRMERGEEIYPGKTAGEVKRGKGRKRGDPPGEMAIGGERMERGEEAYPGKTTGGDERETGVEGETDNSIRASKGPVPSIFSSCSFHILFLVLFQLFSTFPRSLLNPSPAYSRSCFNLSSPFSSLPLTPLQPIPGPASTSLHPSPVSP